MVTFTVIYEGVRFVRQFTPAEAILAAHELKAWHEILTAGYTVLLRGDDNVTHILRVRP